LIVALGYVAEKVDYFEHYKPNYGGAFCFINNLNGLIIFFILPNAVTIIENVTLFILNIVCIVKFIQLRNDDEKTKVKIRFLFKTFLHQQVYFCLL